jgi:predicted DNA-binding transcriptional regulator AlpA
MVCAGNLRDVAREDSPTAPDPKADWWVPEDVAAYLGVSTSTVGSYKARGQMPEPDRHFGRTPAWRPARIIEWHDARPGHGGRPPKRPRSSTS